jgi:hypothetical protein
VLCVRQEGKGRVLESCSRQRARQRHGARTLQERCAIKIGQADG